MNERKKDASHTKFDCVCFVIFECDPKSDATTPWPFCGAVDSVERKAYTIESDYVCL